MDQHIAEAARDDLKRVRRAKRQKLRGDEPRGRTQIYVGYVYDFAHKHWLLVGFARSRGVLKPRKAEKLRKRFTIPDGACFRLIELFVARATGPGRAPSYTEE
jgi:hypothetical protein